MSGQSQGVEAKLGQTKDPCFPDVLAGPRFHDGKKICRISLGLMSNEILLVRSLIVRLFFTTIRNLRDVRTL